MEFGVSFYIWPVILIKFNHLLFYGRMCVCVFLLNVSTHRIFMSFLLFLNITLRAEYHTCCFSWSSRLVVFLLVHNFLGEILWLTGYELYPKIS